MDVALAALIAAYQLSEDEGGRLRATLPLAGRTVIEYQARQAVRTGANHIVVLVERMPADLLAALDRLRSDGIQIDVARNVADAADRIHPDEALLLIGDGCAAGAAWMSRVAEGKVPTILTAAEKEAGACCERIDAWTRWAGVALLDGARLRHVAAMLGEWDLQSTLLRAAVQEGAHRIDATAALQLASPDEIWVVADRAQALAGFERKLIGSASGAPRDWADKIVIGRIAALALPSLLRSKAESWWFSVLAVLLTAIATPLFLLGWRWTALVFLLLSAPALTVAGRLDQARLLSGRTAAQAEKARGIAAYVALFALGWDMSALAGWGVLPLVTLIAFAMFALHGARALLRSRNVAPATWLASVDTLVWVFVPLALFGGWLVGLGVAAFYAAGSFAAAQQRLRRSLSTPAAPTQV
jgi:hypothetical protein